MRRGAERHRPPYRPRTGCAPRGAPIGGCRGADAWLTSWSRRAVMPRRAAGSTTTCCVHSSRPPTRWSRIIDGAGRILLVNRALEEFCGRTADELHGRCFWDVYVAPEHVVLAQDAVERAIASGTALPPGGRLDHRGRRAPPGGHAQHGARRRRRAALRDRLRGHGRHRRPPARGAAPPAGADRPAHRDRQPGRAVRRAAPASWRTGRAARCCSATSTSSRRSTTSTGTPSATGSWPRSPHAWSG